MNFKNQNINELLENFKSFKKLKIKKSVSFSKLNRWWPGIFYEINKCKQNFRGYICYKTIVIKMIFEA